MRVYFDVERDTIVVNGIARYFKNGNLVAEAFGNDVAIKYLNSDVNEIFDDYQSFQKENGDSAGITPQEVVDYLNGEFNSSEAIEGDANFTGVQAETTIADARLQAGDVIYIMPTVNVINEVYFPTVVNINNEFTVRRIVINALNGLTVNLPFRWRKLR